MRRSQSADGGFSLSLSRPDSGKPPGRHPQMTAHQCVEVSEGWDRVGIPGRGAVDNWMLLLQQVEVWSG